VQRSAPVACAALVAACWLAGGPARGEQPLAFTHASAGLLERLVGAGLPQEPLALALRAFACGRTRGEFSEPILTLVDYSRPSAERRLWVLDLETGDVLFHELVAHGRASGVQRATAFSNVPGSKRSSLGLFRTAEVYLGQHGYSLRLDGLERGVNDRARERAIVVHSAGYASEDFASRHGRLGRSWGCPVLDPAVHRQVIDAIRGGTAWFAYYPDADWLSASSFLECEGEPVGALHLPLGER
jgi:hypothetical protein